KFVNLIINDSIYAFIIIDHFNSKPYCLLMVLIFWWGKKVLKNLLIGLYSSKFLWFMMYV
ncbi:MAG: hypothetical protein SOY02_04205, partial [Candidatus Onthovivens sp.]|nr:hypothetical protein [Candidatus Onthovivens sp.]